MNYFSLPKFFFFTFSLYFICLFISTNTRAKTLEPTPTVQIEPKKPIPNQKIKLIYNDSFSDGRDLYAHFGFNGWNIPLKGVGSGQTDDSGNVDYFLHLKMQYNAAKKNYSLETILPKDARAIHMAFCWNTCGLSEWDNNNSQDFSWPVVFPYIGPLLSWTEQTTPDKGIVIGYESGFATTTTLKIWHGQSPPKAIVSPHAQAYRFVLKDLTPNTRYSYQFSTAEGFKSEVFSFKTALSQKGLNHLGFVVFGDAQDNGENGRFAEIAKAIARDQPDINFVISTGDLPSNDKPGNWWTFFDKGRGLLSSFAFMPTLGNHDTPTADSNPDHTSFLRYFALPQISQDHAFYKFTFGSAAFFGMNSERSNEMSDAGLQYRWLADKLEHREQPWNFVFWHVPPFNIGARHYQEESRTRPLTHLFEGKIDWAFSGHEHLFQRFKPIRFSGNDPKEMPFYGLHTNEGVGYLVVPGAGVDPGEELASIQDNPTSRKLVTFPVLRENQVSTEGFSGYTRVNITGETVELKIFAVNSIPGAKSQSLIKDQVRYSRKK